MKIVLHTLITRSAAPVTNHSLPGSTSTQRTQPKCPLMTYKKYHYNEDNFSRFLLTRINFHGACHCGLGITDTGFFDTSACN
jgi:hypothetical protein